MRPSVPDVHITDALDTELSAYRAIAGRAVVALIFGLLSPLALVDPLLWAIPIVGVLFGILAIRQIRTDPGLTGRKMAVAGITLSLLMAAAAPSDWCFYRWKIRGEAREFADQWFRYLAQDEPRNAYQLTVPPPLRQSLEHPSWAYYRDNERPRDALEGYVKVPLVRTLLAMGPKAMVRFYTIAGQVRDDSVDVVELLYAVTYEEDGQKKSFLVSVQAMRRQLPNGAAGWHITQTNGCVRLND